MDIEKKRKQYITQLEQVEQEIVRLQQGRERLTGALLALQELEDEESVADDSEAK